MSVIAIGLLTITSCNKEDDKTAPVPSFTFEINDKTVTFTNTSTDATSYSWDFGDGSALSTEQNPTYTYATYSDYDVRLTATGDGGSETNKTTISVVRDWPTVNIDGDFSDWNDIESFYTGYADAAGNLIEAKVTSNSSYSKLYIYVKGQMDADFPVLQIMINYDNDLATGWSDTLSGLLNDGADIQFEFDVVGSWSSVWDFGPDDPDPYWPWETEITKDTENGDITETSGVVGGMEVEFVIETSLLPGMSTEQIGLYFWQQPEDWSATSGSLPPIYIAEGDTYYEVKMFSFQ